MLTHRLHVVVTKELLEDSMRWYLGYTLSLFVWLIVWLVGWLVGRLIVSLVSWLDGWLLAGRVFASVMVFFPPFLS